MSFTAAYSKLMALDTDAGERLDRAPRITDWDGLHAWPDTRGDISSDTFRDLLVTDEWTDHDAYPAETWRVLKGFKTWKPTEGFNVDLLDGDFDNLVSIIESHEDRERGPLGYRYNLERIGIPYDGEDGFWRSFFAGVSEFTEPFAVYHSPIAHRFPDVTDFADGHETVYYIEAVNGQLYAEEQRFHRVDIEKLVTETQRVADHAFCTLEDI